MDKFRMSIFAGSTMLTHDSDTMYGVLNALHELGRKMPEYSEVFADYEEMDSYMEKLVLLKNGTIPYILYSSPYLRIERYEGP